MTNPPADNTDQKHRQERDSHPDQTDHRTRRAREEKMDVSLARAGGLYEVRSASGNTYEVDIGTGTCSCPDWQQSKPDGGCKHIRRVDMEIKANSVPRPDGRLPSTMDATASTAETTVSTPVAAVATDGGDLLTTNSSGNEQFATCMNRIAERAQALEYEIDQHRAELKDLECALSVIEDYLPEKPPNVNESESASPPEAVGILPARDRSQPAD